MSSTSESLGSETACAATGLRSRLGDMGGEELGDTSSGIIGIFGTMRVCSGVAMTSVWIGAPAHRLAGRLRLWDSVEDGAVALGVGSVDVRLGVGTDVVLCVRTRRRDMWTSVGVRV